MTAEKRPDLASIEPIAPLPEENAEEQRERADRVGFAAAATAGSTPAVGVAAEEMDEAPPEASPVDARDQSDEGR
jgi:hypothetical protein